MDHAARLRRQGHGLTAVHRHRRRRRRALVSVKPAMSTGMVRVVPSANVAVSVGPCGRPATAKRTHAAALLPVVSSILPVLRSSASARRGRSRRTTAVPQDRPRPLRHCQQMPRHRPLLGTRGVGQSPLRLRQRNETPELNLVELGPVFAVPLCQMR